MRAPPAWASRLCVIEEAYLHTHTMVEPVLRSVVLYCQKTAKIQTRQNVNSQLFFVTPATAAIIVDPAFAARLATTGQRLPTK